MTRLAVLAWFGCLVGSTSSVVADDVVLATKFLERYCLRCHGAEKAKGDLRLDKLRAIDTKSAETWRHVLERVEQGDMPPKKEPQPLREESLAFTRSIRIPLAHLDRDPQEYSDRDFPHHGNAVPHELLFPPDGSQVRSVPGASPTRIWRLSPYAYRQQVDELTRGFVGVLRGKITSRGTPLIASPFGLTSDPEFRDYAFRYGIGGSEIEQLALNAKLTAQRMLVRNGRYAAPKALTGISDADAKPSEKQIHEAIVFVFNRALRREPAEDELSRYTKFTEQNLAKFGNRKGIVLGITAVLMHPEAVFRLELGRGEPDEHGRVMLAPLELAIALSYAVTDQRPDEQLMQAVREGKLESRADVEREVRRLLADDNLAKPRVLRFFQEYFGYTAAPDVFKDDPVLRKAGFQKYYPERLVEDTDRLILHILDRDRDVLRELLTTEMSFVGVSNVPHWIKFTNRRIEQAKAKGVEPARHPFDKKNKLNEHYNFDPKHWSIEMPFALPKGQRAGILTQPAWLIAHSTNTDNHAIHRGKWIRERLLGGKIPDTPITVDAQLPDEPEKPLRHRMRVTREAYCWTCHQRMDPLGLPLEMYDHLGRFRTTELDAPVDTTGAIHDSGEQALDGEVRDGIEMIHRLAESPRVRQVFVRHAFRYWMGRNETLADAATLQAVDRAYVKSKGSMQALLLSLLTSDPFLYRTTNRKGTGS